MVPSSGLLSTNGGLIGAAAGGAPSSSASSSRNAENLICRPAVPCSDATFPARVLMSNDVAAWAGVAAATAAAPVKTAAASRASERFKASSTQLMTARS